MKTFRKIMAAAMLSAAALTLSSCYISISKEERQKIKEKIKTEGKYTVHVEAGKDSLEVTLNQTKIEGLASSGAIDVCIHQCEGAPRLVLRGNKEALECIVVEEEDNTLKLNIEKGKALRSGVLADFYTSKLTTIMSNGSGDLCVGEDTGFKADTLLVISNGSGDSFLHNIEAKSVVVNTLGSGDIAFDVLTSSNGVFSTVGSGDFKLLGIEIEKMVCNTMGSGDFKISGHASEATLSRLGSGNIDASHLECEKLETAKQKGSGKVIYPKSE